MNIYGNVRFLLKLTEVAMTVAVTLDFSYIHAHYATYFYDQEFLRQIFCHFMELILIETLGANQTG